MISNPLLKKAQTVLFLNKIDLLRAKLEAGVEFGHYVVSYGSKPNDYGSVSTCESRTAVVPMRSLTICEDLRKKFAHIHKQYSPEQRVLYCHLTTMTVSAVLLPSCVELAVHLL